jgi:hypothetical protein
MIMFYSEVLCFLVHVASQNVPEFLGHSVLQLLHILCLRISTLSYYRRFHSNLAIH